MRDASLPVVMLWMSGSCWQEGPSKKRQQGAGGSQEQHLLRLAMALGIFNLANNADKPGSLA